jgi:Mg2+ and Co2+ transporter CorA
LDWPFGEYAVLGLMVAIGVTLLILFHRKKWI